MMFGRIWTIKLYIFIFFQFQGNLLVLSACSGSGFPVGWTTSTPGVTFWFVTESIKRQFSASYVMTDYYVSNGNVYGAAPTCESEYYDSSTGYYYYLMHYSLDNVYSTSKNIQVCHAFKQYDSVIREYYHDLAAPGVLSVATDCVTYFTSATSSIALTKYNWVYIDCPFSNEQYNFTFSNGGNADYCSGQDSTASISYEVIALKSCYDFNLVSKSNPFYGAFQCLSYWPAESRDTPASGDFIVIEMYDASAWPYCGRYKVAANGIITLSLYLSMSEDSWFPVFCDASQNNEYYFESGTTKYTRMIFTPLIPHTESPTTATEPTTSESTTEMTTSEATTTTIAMTTTESTTSTTRTETVASTDTTTTTTTATTTGNSTATLSSSTLDKIKDLYWPWWILVAAALIIITTILCCIIYACKRKKKPKIGEQKQTVQRVNVQSAGKKIAW